ncbi:hypothetical protein MMC17_006068 [Xylographa soralifera]|nr:hypothetical protein [Xylographa soralifera]
MRLPHLLYAVSVFLLSSAAASSPFPPIPYFHESPSPDHLDARYASPLTLYRSQRRLAVIDLTHSYLATMADLGTTTWLAHDTLLSWHLGQQPLPWVANVTMHVPISNLTFLAAYYNMTVHRHGISQYLLDINPRYVERNGSVDAANGVDARWVDMQNGLYVDVAAVVDGWGAGRVRMLVAKDGRAYERDAVFPLHESTFQESRACVPRDAEAVLAREYGEGALRRKVFRGYG